MKVVVSYRVLQSWRRPVFERLNERLGGSLVVITSKDFNGTKVINCRKGDASFWRRIWSFNIKFKTRRGNFCLPVCPSLILHLLKEKPDVIITEGPSNIFNNFVCFLYAKMCGAKIIQWGLGELPGRKRNAMSRILKKAIGVYEGWSDGAIGYSSIARNYYINVGIKKEFVSTGINVVDTARRVHEIDDFLAKSGIADLCAIKSEKRLVVLGALETNKNVGEFLEVLSSYGPWPTGLLVDIVGDGPERESLESFAAQNGLRFVRFLGQVDGPLADVLCSASAVVVPGLGGLVMSEALIHGVPVICGPADGSEFDLLGHQKELILPDIRTAQNLWASTLKEHILSPSRVRAIREKALQQRSLFTIDKYVADILKTVNRVRY